MLNLRLAKASAKPHPIPSDPPVITTQDPEPYIVEKSGVLFKKCVFSARKGTSI